MIFLSAEDTEHVLDWPAAIACIRAAYAADPRAGNSPGRLIAKTTDVTLRCLPAIAASRQYMGTKHIVQPRSGRPTYLIALFAQEDGRLAYLMDGLWVTAMRTAATSALALQMLSRDGKLDLAVLGSGLEAAHHVEAIRHVADIASLTVYSPSESNRRAFAERFAEKLRIPACAAASPREAVADASHVVAAARSRDETPILHGEWLRPDALVVSIGSTVPAQREIDVSVVERARLIVSDEPHEMTEQTGDMIAAAERGIRFADKLHSLRDLVTGALDPTHARGDGVVLFKSIGSALQDIALAERVAERASDAGLGVVLPVRLAEKEPRRKQQQSVAAAVGG
jgi:alanine dehydrogenase